MHRGIQSRFLVHPTPGETGRYGVNSLGEMEIVGLLDVFPFGSGEPFRIDGGIRVCHRVLALLDLRARQEMQGAMDYDESCCIILLESRAPQRPALVGWVVESIHE
jgi:chemotaxis signal transduction protein